MINAFLAPYPAAAPSASFGATSPALSLRQGQFTLPSLHSSSPPPAVTTSFGASLLAPKTSAHTDAPLMHGILFPWPPKILSHLQDSISGMSWNAVKICVFAMGTFKSRSLCGSGYKSVCLKLYFCALDILQATKRSSPVCQ